MFVLCCAGLFCAGRSETVGDACLVRSVLSVRGAFSEALGSSAAVMRLLSTVSGHVENCCLFAGALGAFVVWHVRLCCGTVCGRSWS